MRPPRHDEHRGRQRSASHPVPHPSVTGNRAAYSGTHRSYDSAKFTRAARVLPRLSRQNDEQLIVAKAPVFVPEGPRRKLAGGRPAPTGAAPGCGTKRAMPQRGIEEVLCGVHPAVFRPATLASVHFLRCPAGARSHPARFPGAASAGADLPPANLLRRPSGTETGRSRVHRVRSVEVVRIFHRSLAAPRAATGTVALRLGCGSASRCSSCLGSSSTAAPLPGSG